jgi:hypothetical protein
MSAHEKEVWAKAEDCFYYQGVRQLTDSDLGILNELVAICHRHGISGPLERFALGETRSAGCWTR